MTEETHTADGRLRSFTERLDRLEDDKAAIVADIKEVYLEAKGDGYDTKILRKVVKALRTDRAKRQEEAAIMELYLAQLGEA